MKRVITATFRYLGIPTQNTFWLIVELLFTLNIISFTHYYNPKSVIDKLFIKLNFYNALNDFNSIKQKKKQKHNFV